MASELGDTVFEREFESLDAQGNSGIIKLRVGQPFLHTDSDGYVDWRCSFQLIGIGSGKIREARGVDALDAMLFSLRMADAWLKSYTHRKITWLGQDDLGLSFSPPVEFTAEEKAKFNADTSFEDIFNDFFAQLDKKRKDAR